MSGTGRVERGRVYLEINPAIAGFLYRVDHAFYELVGEVWVLLCEFADPGPTFDLFRSGAEIYGGSGSCRVYDIFGEFYRYVAHLSAFHFH